MVTRCVMGALGAVLGFGAADARAVIIRNYQEDVSPTASYQHLGSEIRESIPTGNGGGGGLIRTGGDNKLRTVFAFDLGVPQSYTVTGIQLQMHEDSLGDGSGPSVTVEAHQLTNTTPMIEGNGDFLGTFTDPTGVTWNRIQNNGTSDIPWTNPGGDFSATILSTVTVASNTPSFHTFATSVAFVNAANDALQNNGGLLQLILYAPGSENFFGNFVRWDSDDAAASFRPLLTITYVPEPATAALGLIVAGGLLLRRRHP